MRIFSIAIALGLLVTAPTLAVNEFSEDDRPRSKRHGARNASCTISQDALDDRHRRRQQTEKRTPGPGREIKGTRAGTRTLRRRPHSWSRN